MIMSLLLSACNQDEKTVLKVMVPPKPRVRNEPENQLDSLYAVLPLEEGGYLFKNARPTELTRVEIMVVDSLLVKTVTEHNQAQEVDYQELVEAHPEIPFRKENYFIALPNYRRQLIAVINSKGEKEVWVNCLCINGGSYWRAHVVDAMDGGNCYFNVKINLTKKVSYDLMVNGHA